MDFQPQTFDFCMYLTGLQKFKAAWQAFQHAVLTEKRLTTADFLRFTDALTEFTAVTARQFEEYERAAKYWNEVLNMMNTEISKRDGIIEYLESKSDDLPYR